MSKKPAKRKPAPKTVKVWFPVYASSNTPVFQRGYRTRREVVETWPFPARQYRLVPVKPKRKAKP